jgi:hypothetical protein
MTPLEAELAVSREETDHLSRSVRRFVVGREEINIICVEASLWTGLKTNSTNAAGRSTPVRRGACRFEVGERERHQFEIQVGVTGVNALIDGRPVEFNLFPRIHAVIIAGICAFIIVFSLLMVMACRMIASAIHLGLTMVR